MPGDLDHQWRQAQDFISPLLSTWVPVLFPLLTQAVNRVLHISQCSRPPSRVLSKQVKHIVCLQWKSLPQGKINTGFIKMLRQILQIQTSRNSKFPFPNPIHAPDLEDPSSILYNLVWLLFSLFYRQIKPAVFKNKTFSVISIVLF